MLSQMTARPDGSCLKQSLYFVWDLEVAEEWEPRAADGEVARFERWAMPRLEHEVLVCLLAYLLTCLLTHSLTYFFLAFYFHTSLLACLLAHFPRIGHEVREGELLRPAMRLVMADFLIRHGAITPDNEPDYERIILAMHQERLVL